MYGECVNVENLTAPAHHKYSSELCTLYCRKLFAAATNFNRFVVNAAY